MITIAMLMDHARGALPVPFHLLATPLRMQSHFQQPSSNAQNLMRKIHLKRWINSSLKSSRASVKLKKDSRNSNNKLQKSSMLKTMRILAMQ